MLPHAPDARCTRRCRDAAVPRRASASSRNAAASGTWLGRQAGSGILRGTPRSRGGGERACLLTPTAPHPRRHDVPSMSWNNVRLATSNRATHTSKNMRMHNRTWAMDDDASARDNSSRSCGSAAIFASNSFGMAVDAARPRVCRHNRATTFTCEFSAASNAVPVR